MRASLYKQHSGAVHVHILGNYYDFIISLIINYINYYQLYYDYIDLIVIITMIIIIIRCRYDYIMMLYVKYTL